jgi:hypothetical protein
MVNRPCSKTFSIIMNRMVATAGAALNRSRARRVAKGESRNATELFCRSPSGLALSEGERRILRTLQQSRNTVDRGRRAEVVWQ